MKLKMMTSMAGNDYAISPGDVTERFSGDEAERLIAAGYAERVAEAAPAGKAKAETAVKKQTGEAR